MIRLSQAQEHPLCSQGGTRVLWSATATTSLEISSILASNSSLFLRCEMSRARCTIRRRSRRGSSKHEGGNVHPQPLARTCLDLQVKIRNAQLLRSALLDAAIADTDLRSQGAVTVQDFIARPVQHVRR